MLEIETETRTAAIAVRVGHHVTADAPIKPVRFNHVTIRRGSTCLLLASVPLTLTKKSSNNKLMLDYRSGDNTIKSHHQIYI
jgi:hypothetical protein